MRILWRLLLIGIALSLTSAVYAQRPPAIPGVTGTLATDATVKEEHKIANKIVVATEDGVEHIFPAGKGPLSDLKPGTTVAIYSASKVTEGTVQDVKRSENEIVVRFANGTRETLKLADKIAVDAGQALKNPPEGSTRVVVYYSDEARGRIARYFNPKS